MPELDTETRTPFVGPSGTSTRRIPSEVFLTPRTGLVPSDRAASGSRRHRGVAPFRGTEVQIARERMHTGPRFLDAPGDDLRMALRPRRRNLTVWDVRGDVVGSPGQSGTVPPGEVDMAPEQPDSRRLLDATDQDRPVSARRSAPVLSHLAGVPGGQLS